MRRLAALPVLLALVLVPTGAADFQRVDRGVTERGSVPRLRAGTIQIPRDHVAGRLRVIVALRQPPLAAVLGRSLQSTGASRRLDVRSTSSRAYLAQLASAQRAAVSALRRAIPEARVSTRFSIVLNGLTVTLPATRLPRLARLPFADRIYPSLRYTLALNQSPSVIAAEVLSARTGARGDGIKIGVIDDGVDEEHPFFNPAGFSYPNGFPRGGVKWTTAKVIVARTFPGPGAGKPGRMAVDRRASFHGTHVAGIAAGIAGTRATRGRDHPPVTGLSGVAPRAWLGNYRVFTVPSPIGHVANTPEIVEAFEWAVKDGMDVVNFSGGGPSAEPSNDALIEVVDNTAAAGVVPVISAGNDREEFGLGSAGSPGIAPEAISVAAVSNSHVFATVLTVTSPEAAAAVKQIPFVPASGSQTPTSWEVRNQTLVDVGTVVGRNGQPVNRLLCGSSEEPNDPAVNQLPRGSLDGVIALASRGVCTFVSKAARAKAAGAVGLILVNNRPGEAARIPLALEIPSGMVADLEGERLRAAMAASGGRATIQVGSDPEQIQTGRSGIVTSFSSGGPTAFGHQLKPDVSAPGGEILSSTLPEFAGSHYAVFDGTSMSAPHVAGAVALLRQRHATWGPRQLKSALVTTAGPAWANTERTIEAPVVLGGAGLVNVPAADDPKLFTDPVSLSFDDLNVNRAARRQALLVSITDAGGGAGTWQVELRPQSASVGANLELPSAISLPPGGSAQLPVVAVAAASAEAGDDYGFIVLRRGDLVRRIPYFFSVTRPGLELRKEQPRPLRKFQVGDTRVGVSRASIYRYPSAPFGTSPNVTGPGTQEDGAERVYVTRITRPVANLGVAVIRATPGDALIHPWVLGSLDENDVQGYAGTPVNVNPFTFDFLADIGAAAAVLPRQQRFFVSVDSGADRFTGKAKPGRYLLRFWVNDLRPPFVQLLTPRVAAGRPMLAVRATDTGAGVNPLSLVLAYRGVLVGASLYDPDTGIALFPLPEAAPALKAPMTEAVLVASDYQESKNVNTIGENLMPNTSFREVKILVGKGPTVAWLRPGSGACAVRRETLVVTTSATRKLRSVRFYDGTRLIKEVKTGVGSFYSTPWPTTGKSRGRHKLVAEVVDASGAQARASRTVRVCR